MEIKHITLEELNDRIRRNDGAIKAGLQDLHFRLTMHDCKKSGGAPSYYVGNAGAYCTHCNKAI